MQTTGRALCHRTEVCSLLLKEYVKTFVSHIHIQNIWDTYPESFLNVVDHYSIEKKWELDNLAWGGRQRSPSITERLSKERVVSLPHIPMVSWLKWHCWHHHYIITIYCSFILNMTNYLDYRKRGTFFFKLKYSLSTFLKFKWLNDSYFWVEQAFSFTFNYYQPSFFILETIAL